MRGGPGRAAPPYFVMSHPPPIPETPAPTRSLLAAVLPVALIALCGELGIAVLNNSALPVYFSKGLGINVRLLGLILLPFFISEVLFKSPLGVLADRWGRKPLMMAGTLITVFTPLILIAMRYDAAAPTAAAVLIGFGFLRLLDGLGAAALWPALFAYVGDVVEEARRGRAMAILTGTYMVGLALSFLAGGWVDDTFGPVLSGEASLREQMTEVGQRIGSHLHRHGAAAIALPPIPATERPEHYLPSFYLGSALFALAAILTAIFVRNGTHRQTLMAHDEPTTEEKITWASFRETLQRVPHFLLLAFTTFAGMGCIATLVKLFAMDEFALSEKQVGFLVLWPAIFIGIVTVPVGHLADRWGKTRCVRLGFLLCAMGLWAIPLLHHWHTIRQTAFVLAASVLGLGFALAFPAWMALLTSISREGERGAVLGAVSTAQGVGAMVGVLCGPALYERVSHIAPFVAAATLVTVGAVFALLFVREHKPPASG